MQYTFTPTDGHRAGTTIVLSNALKIRFEPGTGEVDDAVWAEAKNDSTVKQLLESEVLRVNDKSQPTAKK